MDSRSLVRDEVHYRARAFGPDARQVTLLIVNLSAAGLMARADLPYAVGDRMRVTLPIVGVLVAEIRWSLGGRIGCEFDGPIPLADYYELLATLLKPL
ncbi:PilZ domain-containing protein [Sphingomonas sp. RB3P16]|uniref:PilZ domain-containing protein n=1 Tax=Parasphingomonas frigoris TaxID=3096163 RepID=UPI002FC85BC3